MFCPLCQNSTKVLESRTTAQNSSIRRRRECLGCKFRFSTIEEIEILDLQIVKRNEDTETYNREKLTRGIQRSLQKRPIVQENFKKLINDIERDIQLTAKNNIISSSEIGELVMRHLKNFDTVAYVRFASVYRDFKDPEDFAKEVQKLGN
jgi:transcriptional repressor NrdR